MQQIQVLRINAKRRGLLGSFQLSILELKGGKIPREHRFGITWEYGAHQALQVLRSNSTAGAGRVSAANVTHIFFLLFVEDIYKPYYIASAMDSLLVRHPYCTPIMCSWPPIERTWRYTSS